MIEVIQDPLFPGYEPEPISPPTPLSAGARRTVRQHQLVTAGIHPLTHTPTRPALGTCGDCQWRVLGAHHGRSYPKCTLPGTVGRGTHGAASDCRAWWPACSDHTPFEVGDIRCRQCTTIGPAAVGSKTICQRCKGST